MVGMGLSLTFRKMKKEVAKTASFFSFIKSFEFVDFDYLLSSLNRSLHLRHVAARDGERFVAVLDEQLSGARM